MLVLPYIVDENTLEKSSKQPKFVKNRDLSAYDAGVNDDEWKPRGYCRHSIYVRTVSAYTVGFWCQTIHKKILITEI